MATVFGASRNIHIGEVGCRLESIDIGVEPLCLESDLDESCFVEAVAKILTRSRAPVNFPFKRIWTWRGGFATSKEEIQREIFKLPGAVVVIYIFQEALLGDR